MVKQFGFGIVKFSNVEMVGQNNEIRVVRYTIENGGEEISCSYFSDNANPFARGAMVFYFGMPHKNVFTDKDGKRHEVFDLRLNNIVDATNPGALLQFDHRVICAGHMGKDPEKGNSEKTVANYSLACKATGAADSEWIDISSWEMGGEVMLKHGRKGMALSVCGKMQTRRYRSSKHECDCVTQSLVSHNFTFLGSGKKTTNASSEAAPEPEAKKPAAKKDSGKTTSSKRGTRSTAKN